MPICKYKWAGAFGLFVLKEDEACKDKHLETRTRRNCRCSRSLCVGQPGCFCYLSAWGSRKRRAGRSAVGRAVPWAVACSACAACSALAQVHTAAMRALLPAGHEDGGSRWAGDSHHLPAPLVALGSPRPLRRVPGSSAVPWAAPDREGVKTPMCIKGVVGKAGEPGQCARRGCLR